MKRTIKNPHWINNARTVLSVEFHYDDGRVMSAVINGDDQNNTDLLQVQAEFSPEQIEENTRKAITKQARDREMQEKKEAAQKDKERQERLFNLKLQAFDVEVIKQTTEKKLKSALRRAKSDMEVYAFASAIILKEHEKAQTQDTQETTEE
jgi:hypothetical protein